MAPPVITVVHCWSAPRSRSTALLYSFEARWNANADNTNACPTVAIDEPLYRRWLLDKGDAVIRPYTSEMIEGVPPQKESGEPTEEEARRWARERESLAGRIGDGVATICKSDSAAQGGVVFCKHMAKHGHLYDFDAEAEVGHPPISPNEVEGSDLLIHKHVLLIRDPVAVLSSWDDAGTVHSKAVTPDEVGIIPMLGIYSTLMSRRQNNNGANGCADDVVILDSDDLAHRPKETLSALCAGLDIPYTDSMLTWDDGPHECDGPWADWWYANVHKSTGWFGHDPKDEDEGTTVTPPLPGTCVPKSSQYRTLNPALLPTLEASLPAYDYLRSRTAGHRSRGPPPSEIYEDPRNEHVLVYIGAPGRGRIVPRSHSQAGVSPWDSSVQGGDAAWEGLRVYDGKVFKLERHLRRLFKSAKALGFENVHSKEEVIEAIFRTLAANGMRDGAHMRLTLTRGEKCTSSMNPKFNVYGTTLIILAEWKPTEGATTYDNTKGISLITASTRRNSPSTVDSKIHHNNMINNILPKIEANLAHAADALMLDLDGFVSETNATNVFMVDDSVLITPHADHCLPGITRETVINLAAELGIPCEVRRVSLAEFHSADEVFTTGTMGELTPVKMIDGRNIGTGQRGPVTARLQEAYKNTLTRWSTELPPFASTS